MSELSIQDNHVLAAKPETIIDARPVHLVLGGNGRGIAITEELHRILVDPLFTEVFISMRDEVLELGLQQRVLGDVLGLRIDDLATDNDRNGQRSTVPIRPAADLRLLSASFIRSHCRLGCRGHHHFHAPARPDNAQPLADAGDVVFRK